MEHGERVVRSYRAGGELDGRVPRSAAQVEDVARTWGQLEGHPGAMAPPDGMPREQLVRQRNRLEQGRRPEHGRAYQIALQPWHGPTRQAPAEKAAAQTLGPCLR